MLDLAGEKDILVLWLQKMSLFFLLCSLCLESGNIFRRVLTNIWFDFPKKQKELWKVIFKTGLDPYIVCLVKPSAKVSKESMHGGRLGPMLTNI